MKTQEQIDQYISGQPEPKRKELHALHQLIMQAAPKSKLWFSDGRNADGKVVSNPSIGYGTYTIHYADGSSKEFYRIGLSANTAGISVYLLGIEDKTYLARTYGKRLGKASVTGYCIKFKTTKNIHLDVLEAAIKERTAQKN